jgi:ubiquinone/menaquinone biosynthesis C-methylase UbiE
VSELIRDVSTQEGYALWSTSYDQEDNALIVLEEAYVDPLLASLPFTSVLDVGAGTGRYSLKLARKGAHVTALDQSAAMLAVARQAAEQENLAIEFQCTPVDEGLPFSAEQFDLVVSALMLCHVPDMARAIEEFSRVLQPGGYLLITDFHPDSVQYGWRTQFQQAGIEYHLPNMPHTRSTYLDALQMSGLEPVKVIDLPFRALPDGYFPEQFMRTQGDRFFCLIMLARKVAKTEGV